MSEHKQCISRLAGRPTSRGGGVPRCLCLLAIAVFSAGLLRAESRERQADKPWWVGAPLRIVEICDALDFQAVSLDRQAQAVSELGGNVQHFHCMSMAADAEDTAGLNDKRFFFKSALSRRENPDRLAAYLPLAHRQGIKVVVYFNVHWYSREFGNEHPDWRQVAEDGAPLRDVYQTGVSCCVNSPYRDWVFQILRDLCRYDIDGVFYDGPVFFDRTCYCPACKKLFKERTGHELPSKSDRASPLWRELVEFQADSIARFLADSNKVIKAINPQILLYMNGNANWPYWPTGRDNRRIIAHTDVLGAEGGFLYGDLNETSIYKPGITAKLISHQARGKPTVVFNCAGHKPWSWYLMPETEIGLLLARTLAGGANYWLAVFPDDLDQPELRVVGRFGRFVAAHPSAFVGSRSLARVALLWPARGCNFCANTKAPLSSVPLTDFTRQTSASGAGDLTVEFNGLYEALARAQVPFDVIDEEGLESMPAYDLVVLPNAALLSSRAVASLESFVQRGGNLLATFETSLYDENGKRRDDFALGKLYGTAFTGGMFGPMTWDYIGPAAARAAEVMGSTKKYLPAPTYGLKVKPTTGQVLWCYCDRLAGRYEHTPAISDAPFLVENHYGKGKVFYVAGTLGGSLAAYRFREYLALVRNIVAQTAPSPVTLEDAPWVEIAWRQSGDTRYLHLINGTGGLKRPLTSVQPLHNLKIRLKFKADDVRALRSEAILPMHEEADGSWFVLPELRDYEVIAVQPRAYQPVEKVGFREIGCHCWLVQQCFSGCFSPHCWASQQWHPFSTDCY